MLAFQPIVSSFNEEESGRMKGRVEGAEEISLIDSGFVIEDIVVAQ